MAAELREWALNYFQFRKSAMGEEYEIVKPSEDRLELRHRDSTEVVLCTETLSKPPKFSGRLTIVTLNKRVNVDFLAKNWKGFCLPGLRIYFANPKNPHQKWVVSPIVHGRVCEEKNIHASLISMAKAASQVE